MFDIPGIGGRERETKTKEAASKAASEEAIVVRARNDVRQALTEAFGRPVNDNDVHVVPGTRGRFRLLVSSNAVPAKQPLSLFGFTLPFQRRQRGSEIDAALVNVNVGAKRRIFLRLFPQRLGTQYASPFLRDEESLMRFAVDCKQRLGNIPPPEETAKKTEAESKAKGEADAKMAGGPPSRPPLPGGLPGGPLPGGLGGLPGGPAGLPGIPGGSPPASPFGAPAGAPRLPGGPGGGLPPDPGMPGGL